MNRGEAMRRLEDGTRFQFVGDKVLIRNAALIEALDRARYERVDAVPLERDPVLDTASALAA